MSDGTEHKMWGEAMAQLEIEEIQGELHHTGITNELEPTIFCSCGEWWRWDDRDQALDHYRSVGAEADQNE